MPQAIAIPLIGAAASIGGGLLAGSSQKSAANKASDTALQTAQMNNALQRETRDQNVALAQPWMQSGLKANGAINSLLGLNDNYAPQTAPQAQQGYSPYQPTGNALSGGYGVPAGENARFAGMDSGDMYSSPGMQARIPYSPNDAVSVNGAPQGAPQGAPGVPQGTPGGSPYNNAFQNFLNSTGFQFQMDQGNKAINQGYAANGTLQSGAAQKALQDRGQQTALSNYFMPYMNLLGQQQGVGLSATNATMGVGTNYANNVSANNNNAGDAAANAALRSGQASGAMYTGIANSLGNGLNSYMNSSYGGGGYTPGALNIPNAVGNPLPAPTSYPWSS